MALKDKINELMSARGKQIAVIAGSVIFLVGILYITAGDTDTRERKYRPEKDKMVSVLTNSNNSRIGLENVAGDVKYADTRIRLLEERVQRMQKERDAEQNNTSRDRAWQERYDALSSEVQRLSALIEQQAANPAASISPSTSSKGTAAGKQSEAVESLSENPFEVQDRLDKEAELAAAAAGTPTLPPAAKKNLGLFVASDPALEVKPEEQAPEQKASTEFYIPAGSILTGTIITGADFPTGKGTFQNPTPSLIRLSESAILPNRYTSDVRECFLLAGGFGELSSERAQLRSETISCIRTDGRIIESKIGAYVSGEDGKAGVKGRLVSKQGQMIARTMVAGFLSGMSEAFDYDAVPVLATSSTGTVQYQENFSSEAAKGGIAKGLVNSLDRVAEFYMDLAEQMVPVVEITAGRKVDIIVTKGTTLNVLDYAPPAGINGEN